MIRKAVLGAMAAYVLAGGGLASAGDHLNCFKVKDPLPKPPPRCAATPSIRSACRRNQGAEDREIRRRRSAATRSSVPRAPSRR